MTFFPRREQATSRGSPCAPDKDDLLQLKACRMQAEKLKMQISCSYT